MKDFLKVVLVAILVSAAVNAGAIKSWLPGEVVSTSDLNAALNHIHSKMVGGHGARLVNADITTGTIQGTKLVDGTIQNQQIADGGIANYKLTYGGGVARAFAAIYGACNVAPVANCTLNNPYNITSISHTATGVYVVTWNFTATNTPAVTVSDNLAGVRCWAGTPSSTAVTVTCEDLDTPAATDSAFTITVHEKI